MLHKDILYIKSEPGRRPRPSEKADNGSLEKVDPIPKFTVSVKNSFLTNWRLLISNMAIVFLKFDPKIPK